MQYFEFMLTIEDIGVSKREPDIYLAAAERLGLAPADCMVFEDAPYAGVTAHRAGFQLCVWRNPPTPRGKPSCGASAMCSSSTRTANSTESCKKPENVRSLWRKTRFWQKIFKSYCIPSLKDLHYTQK